MDELKCVEIVGAIGGRPERKVMKIKGVSTDSRIISPGELFVALKGDNFDGHDFIEDAFNKGAVGAIVSRDFDTSRISREKSRMGDHDSQSDLSQDTPTAEAYSQASPHKDKFIIRVDDTLRALGELAKYYRSKLPTKFIGVTGSNGKTTTKEMLSHLLSKRAAIVRSQKSFNNFIGVPLTIFEVESHHQYAVIEMGTSALGEIKRLTEIAQPNVGVITNISETHLLGLKSIEGVANAKAELVETLDRTGVAVLNEDDKWCKKISSRCRCKVITYGLNENADVRALDISRSPRGISFLLNLLGTEHHPISLPVLGIHNVYNALAAIAACLALEYIEVNHSTDDPTQLTWHEFLSDVFSDFHLPPMRLETHHIGNLTLINDAYNANYRSMLAAIEELSYMPSGGRKILVCGDMLELGSYSESLHKKLGTEVAKSEVDILWAVGDQARFVAESAQAEGMSADSIFYSPTVGQAAESIAMFLEDNDTLLVKGSRGMTMEQIVEAIRSR